MAKIHFVKDGKLPDGSRLTRSIDTSIEEAVSKLGSRHTRYSEKPPTINGDKPASDFAPYRYVVVQVTASEARAPFPKAGYYYLVGLTPEKCHQLLGTTGPSV